jgi:YD repeat-containing protein
VIAPDQLTSNQLSVPAGPYATIGLTDGSLQTSHSMPSYNANVQPLGLVYNSAVANPQPIFTVNYQLPSSLPTNVTAQLTVKNQSGTTVYTGATVYYDPSSLNPNDWMQIALQANLTSLASGRYNWAIAVTGSGTTNYSGSFNLINGSTTPTTATAWPFGKGWSLTGVQAIIPVTGGVILQNPDGTSEWFAAGSQSGTFVSPPNDFSTLTQNTTTLVYTLALVDGSQVNFNSSGQQTSMVDRDGNTTSYSWTSGQLVSVTDMNSQVNTITYSSTTNLATTITDPASRTLSLGYNSSNQLTSLTDNDGAVWKYAYDSNNDMTGISDPRSTGTNYTTTIGYDFAYRATSVPSPIRRPSR